MRCAFCPTCNTYPAELLSLPFLGIDEETSEPIRGDAAVVLTNGSGATNRYEDGTVGVTQEEREAADEDDSPICATCRDSDLEWREIEGHLHPVRRAHDTAGRWNGVTMRYCSTSCREQDSTEGDDGQEPTNEIPAGWCCDLCGKEIRPRPSFLEEFGEPGKDQGEAFTAAVEHLWRVSFKQLAYLASHRMTDDDKRQLGDHFMGLAANAARIGAYLEMRGGSGYGDQGHETAVKKQNQVARKVRQVQGYQNTPDIQF